MIDFSIQFNLIVYAVTAGLGLLCLVGNFVAICTVGRRRFGAFSVIYYILTWLIFLASLAVSALAVIYRTQWLPLSDAPFDLPIITPYLTLTFTTLMMEITVYAVAGLSLISLILVPFGWGKKNEYMLPVMPADGDGYITVTDHSQIHRAPVEESAVETSVEEVAVQPAVEETAVETAEQQPVTSEPSVEESVTEPVEESADESVEETTEEMAEEEREITFDEPAPEQETTDDEPVIDDEPETETAEEKAEEDEPIVEEEWIAETDAQTPVVEEDERHEVDFDEPVIDDEPITETDEEVVEESEPTAQEPIEEEKATEEKEEVKVETPTSTTAPEQPPVTEEKVEQPVAPPVVQPAVIVVNERGEILNNSSGAPIIIIKEQIAPVPAPPTQAESEPIPVVEDDGKSKRARVRSRASEMFREYLSSKSDEEKSKLEDSIDHIIKNKK